MHLINFFLTLINKQLVLFKNCIYKINKMNFSSDHISFEYFPDSHLQTTFKISNESNQYICFKFRVTRQQYYKVKPKLGCLKPKQSLQIQITLRKDGVSYSSNDKFKCFYRQSQLFSEDIAYSLHNDPKSKTEKIPVIVNNIPEQFQRTINMRSSGVKSLNNNSQSVKYQSHTIENSITEKREDISKLEHEIAYIKQQKTSEHHGGKASSTSWKTYGILLVFGFAVGVGSSFWI